MTIRRSIPATLAAMVLQAAPVVAQPTLASVDRAPARAVPSDTTAATDSVAPAPVIEAGPDGGLRISSPDGRFELGLKARLQALFQHTTPDVDGRSTADAQPRARIGNESLLRMRRGRLAMSGHVFDPGWEYKIQFEMIGSAFSLRDAFVNWRGRGDAFQVKVGQFKVPFGRQELTSSFKQSLVDRSSVSGEFSHGEDVGAMVWGEPFDGRLEYFVGVFNGEGKNHTRQQDATNQWAARAVWAPAGSVGYDARPKSGSAPKVAFGVNTNVNGGWFEDIDGVPGVQGPTETCFVNGCLVAHGDDARITTAGVDIVGRWGSVAVVAEAFTRTIDPREPGLAELTSSGWFVDGGWRAHERVETGLRYGRIDPDHDTDRDGVVEITPYVTTYLRGDALRIQLDGSLIRSDTGTTGADVQDRRIRLQFVFAF